MDILTPSLLQVGIKDYKSNMNESILLLFSIIAVISSFIGLGGATFYLVSMDFFQFPYLVIPFIALSSNIVVCGITLFTATLRKEQLPILFLAKIIFPSIIFVYLGASIAFTEQAFRLILSSSVLLILIFRIVYKKKSISENIIERNYSGKSDYILILVSMGIGFLSGIIGIGGGIILGPVLFLRGMSYLRIRLVTSIYIFLNSIIGIIAQMSKWLSQTTVADLSSQIAPYVQLVFVCVIGSAFTNIFSGIIKKEHYIKRTALSLMVVVSIFNFIRAGIIYGKN